MSAQNSASRPTSGEQDNSSCVNDDQGHITDQQEWATSSGNEQSFAEGETYHAEVEAQETSINPVRGPLYIDKLIEKGLKDNKILKEIVTYEIKKIISEHSALHEMEVIFLYDTADIDRSHASQIYQHLSQLPTRKNILLILKSSGGEVEPAYLISKMCTRWKDSTFIIGIPAQAKSAATLLALGADELHMGGMSELGPIDPQINDFPALAFSSALEKIVVYAAKHAGAGDMLAKYLIGSQLDLRTLGHYERITESAAQYAIRLLKSKTTSTETNIEEISELANHFTNHYKDHNFVIDIEEAQELLGEKMVKCETPIYKACHAVHNFLATAETVSKVRGTGKSIKVIGNEISIQDLD